MVGPRECEKYGSWEVLHIASIVLQASHESYTNSGVWVLAKRDFWSKDRILLLIPSSILDLPKIDAVVSVVVKLVEDITFACFVPESFATNTCVCVYITKQININV